MLIYVLNFLDRQILSILANVIKADLGVDDAYLGFLYQTAFAIFHAFFGIPPGLVLLIAAIRLTGKASATVVERAEAAGEETGVSSARA